MHPRMDKQGHPTDSPRYPSYSDPFDIQALPNII